MANYFVENNRIISVVLIIVQSNNRGILNIIDVLRVATILTFFTLNGTIWIIYSMVMQFKVAYLKRETRNCHMKYSTKRSCWRKTSTEPFGASFITWMKMTPSSPCNQKQASSSATKYNRKKKPFISCISKEDFVYYTQKEAPVPLAKTPCIELPDAWE